MKVIFVDIDGVLKHYGDMRKGYSFDLGPVRALNVLTRETGAKLVISSTWRMLPGLDLKHIFEQNGVEGEIIGETPVLYGERGSEIEAWLITTGKPVTGYAILDDEDDMGALRSHLVQTDPLNGLTIQDVREAKRVLGERVW